MVRLLIDDVTLAHDSNITAQIRFKGGPTTNLNVTVGLPAHLARRTPAEVVAHIDRLLDDHTESAVAQQLNQAGVRLQHRRSFHTGIVHHIRVNHGLRSRRDRLADRGWSAVIELADLLGVCTKTVKEWHHHGQLIGEPFNDKGECLYQIPPSPPAWPSDGPPAPKTDRNDPRNQHGGAV